MRPETTLLRAIAYLHQQGYEGLKVYTSIYAMGTWRLSLGVIGQPAFTDTFRYSSGSGWDFFAATPFREQEPVAEHVSSEVVAQALLRRYPRLMQAAKFPCRLYVDWYAKLLETCGESGYFYQISDDMVTVHDEAGQHKTMPFNAKDVGYVLIVRGPGQTEQYPLAPIF